ncbi:MAG TPA: DUF1801 domain-containing protein [Candidatus Limnocylindrales bacterium]|nr:DUF1801 domain-containing protein [Candidatus Limnocylindrales bacterium]
MATAGEQAVDAYIAAAPKAVQPMLRELRQAIRSAAPRAEEKISYRMPFYAYHGRLIYFAVHAKHVGMYPIIGREKALYAKELKPYLASKATLQFPIGKPLPIALIKKVVRERARENESRATARPATGRTKKRG